jgi:hypothetical protein
MTSPGGILAAAAGVSAGILLAAPVAAAVGLGAAAWAARVALAIPRAPSAERIDPFTLGEPWRRYVQQALEARKRFDEAIGRVDRGPLRERLQEIGDRLQVGTEECWRIARHAQTLTEARRSIDVDEIRYDLQQVGGQARGTLDPNSPLARTVQALESQLATAARMDSTLSDAESRLRLLDARLDEAVTRAVELSVQAHDTSDLAGLQGEVDSVVSEMEALRLALRETAFSSDPALAPPPSSTAHLPPPPRSAGSEAPGGP